MAQTHAVAQLRDETVGDRAKPAVDREPTVASDRSAQDPRLLASDTTAASPMPDEIAARACQCWHERGCPEGSPEVDWYRAESELKVSRT